jgi:hypothetical protein
MISMKNIRKICERYNVALCYLFGSQKEIGKTLLDGKHVDIMDAESDIDLKMPWRHMHC